MEMMPQEAKKEKLKKLFFTQLNAYEIRTVLELTNNEYIYLLGVVKEELGLPSSYKRNPKKFNKYLKDSYYVATVDNGDIHILTYAPTREYAEAEMENYLETGNGEYFIGQATDEHMKDLIRTDYFEKNLKWDTIMDKYKLPYHSFYTLLNQVKLEENKVHSRTNKSMRYIYQYNNKPLWEIRKSLGGKQKSYGVFNDLNIAIVIRDFLESNDWDLKSMA